VLWYWVEEVEEWVVWMSEMGGKFLSAEKQKAEKGNAREFRRVLGLGRSETETETGIGTGSLNNAG